jgi:hypothetical protein
MVVALRRRDALVAELLLIHSIWAPSARASVANGVAHLPWLALVEAGARADVQGPGL